MRNLFIFFIAVLGIYSCDVPNYDPLETSFYNINLDASDYNDNDAYFLFCTEDYVEKIDVGIMQQMSYYYFGNTLCQLDLRGKRDCLEIIETGQIVEAKEPYLKDLIRFEYSGTTEDVYLYRYFPLEENYFKKDLPVKDTILFLPALLNDQNRIILSLAGSIILDTSFLVTDEEITITF